MFLTRQMNIQTLYLIIGFVYMRITYYSHCVYLAKIVKATVSLFLKPNNCAQ